MSADPDASQWPLIPLRELPTLKPIEDDVIGTFDFEMSLIHNIFIRGINCIWRYAPLVKPGDEVAFAGYSLAIMHGIHFHHRLEETIIFPYFETKLSMNESIEEHKVFQDGMDAFDEYISKVYERHETYDAEKTRSFLKAFADPLVLHLHAEIETVSPEKLKVFKDEDPEGLDRMMQDVKLVAKNEPGKLTTLSFYMTHHDFETAPDWPPFPAPVRWFAQNVAPLRNWSYWKFAPFTPKGAANVYA